MAAEYWVGVGLVEGFSEVIGFEKFSNNIIQVVNGLVGP